MKRWVIVVMVAWTRLAVADHHEVTGASFDSPPGWAAQDAPDHATLVYKTGSTFAIFVVYAPHPAISGGLATAFSPDWKTATVNTPTKTVPKPVARKLAGHNLLEGVADTTMQGSNVTVEVILVELGAQVVPVLVYSQNRAMLKTMQPDTDKMLASLQLAAPAPGPGPAPVPAPTQPAPATSGPRMLTTITLADLAGSWSTHDQAVTTYVDGSTGAYSGTMATSTQDWFQIKADGSYTRTFQGLANGHVVRETGKGTITLAPDAIVFTEAGREYRRFHFLQFAIDADGTAHWQLLDAQYPITQPNIGLYAEKWVRAVVKK
ncbi:MAG TPA: hypothetical protein VFQ65_02180 [Kofleriaceae bacterium]|nr:hypothetical protein [Kofleriaceae bacterium]